MKKIKLMDVVWMAYMVTCILNAMTRIYVMWMESKAREAAWKKNIAEVRERTAKHYNCEEED